jgi:hypothetical protein
MLPVEHGSPIRRIPAVRNRTIPAGLVRLIDGMVASTTFKRYV